MSQLKIGLAAALVFCAANAVADPIVVGTKLNLRSGPGAAFAVIATMPAGAKIDMRTCKGDWCQVTFGRKAGYASRELIEVGSDSYASASP